MAWLQVYLVQGCRIQMPVPHFRWRPIAIPYALDELGSGGWQPFQCSRIKPRSSEMVLVKPWCISRVESTLCRTAILRLNIGELLDWPIIPVGNRWVAVPHAVTALVSLLLCTYFGSASRQC